MTGGQANITGQADLSVATGSVHHEETMDAFALGLIFAVAIGGDATRRCGERGQLRQRPHAWRAPSTTGDATAGNSVGVVGGQTNDNSGDVLTARFGSGVSAISQSNDLGVIADDNSAFANTVATSRRQVAS